MRPQGNLDAAEAGYRDACAFFGSPPVGAKLAEAEGRRGLAVVAEKRGQLEAAMGHVRQALALYERCGHPRKIAECRAELERLGALAGAGAT